MMGEGIVNGDPGGKNIEAAYGSGSKEHEEGEQEKGRANGAINVDRASCFSSGSGFWRPFQPRITATGVEQ